MTLADNIADLSDGTVEGMAEQVNALSQQANPLPDPSPSPAPVPTPASQSQLFGPSTNPVKPNIPPSEKQADRNWEQGKDFTNQMIAGVLLLGVAYFIGRGGR